MVIIDSFNQRDFVLNIVQLLVIIRPLYLEGHGQLKVLSDLNGVSVGEEECKGVGTFSLSPS